MGKEHITESFVLAAPQWISVEDKATEFGQFTLLEKEEKHSERQASKRGQSTVALLKVKNEGGGGGNCTHLVGKKKSKIKIK